MSQKNPLRMRQQFGNPEVTRVRKYGSLRNFIPMEQYTLGIDIGTTSVKVCIVSTKTSEVIAQHVKDTQSNIPSDTGPGGNKQDVPKIISALNLCVSKLPKQHLQYVSKIGICGQMHGIMFWKNEEGRMAWDMIEKDKSVRYDVVQGRVSALYTWQDNRCDPEFLASLPKPQSHLNVSSGFGTATIFWMLPDLVTKQRRKSILPEKLKKYNCCGTIADFAVAMLCNLNKPTMSYQNAASWGYFDCANHKWNSEILQDSGFPMHLLPEVQASGEIAGRLAKNWHTIPKGTPIDAQLRPGTYSALYYRRWKPPQDAVLNISTSAQICFVVDDYEPGLGPPEITPVEYLPYFKISL
ncbi:hypothetical protein NQ318_019088 [Aromia moschata]|uniref:Carbohydrate kinase FGGY N-terminal domain-containing protein n=1 Tax=Aromia moschata TaxID=1265417 RepID=A0AAV8Y7V5_9CUCU|nr:hypothetical protein NQ318_019088 [Aromia moschata]